MAECSHRAPCPGGEYCVCLKCKHRGGLQKVHESKCGLCIYLHTEPEQVQDHKQITKTIPLPGSTSDFPADAHNNNIVIIINNTEEIEKKTADYLPEIDINKISCPRCRYITTRAKALLETVPLIQKNELKSVCGLCFQKKQSPVSCTFCQTAIHKFLSDSQKKEDLSNKLLSLLNTKFIRQPDLNKEIKKLFVSSETDIRKSVGSNKYYDHRLNRPKSGSNIDPKAICKCDEKLACLLQKNLKGKKVTIQVKIESESSEKMISLRDILNQGKLYPEEEVIKGPLKPILKPCLETLQRTGLHSDTVLGIGTTGILRRSRSEETLLSFSKLTEEKYEKGFEYRFPGMKKREKEVIKKTSDELIKDTQQRLQEAADIKLQEKEQRQQKKEERKRSEKGDFEEKTSREKGTKLEKEQRGKGKTEKGKEPQLRPKEGVAKRREISKKPVKVKQEKAERTAEKAAPEKVKGKVAFEPTPEKQKKATAEDASKEKSPLKPSEKETKGPAEAKPPPKKETKAPSEGKPSPTPPVKEEDAGKGKTPPKPSEKETKASAEAKPSAKPPVKEEDTGKGKTSPKPSEKETKASAETKPPAKPSVKEEDTGKGKAPPKPSEKETKASAEAKPPAKPPVKEEDTGKGKTSPKPSEKETKASAEAKPPPKAPVKEEDAEKGKAPPKPSEKETKASAEAKPPAKEEDAGKGKTPKPSEKETKASAKAKPPSKPSVKEETGKGKEPPEPSENEDKPVKKKKVPDTRKVEIPDKQVPAGRIGRGDMRKAEMDVLDVIVKKQEKMTETLKDKKAQGDKLAKDVEKTELAEEPKDKKNEARSRKESKKAESVKEEKGKKSKEVVQEIEMKFSGDNLLANLVKMRDRNRPERITARIEDVPSKVIRPRIRKKPSVRSLPSVLESDIIIQTEEPEMIVGEKIVLRKRYEDHTEVKEQNEPELFFTTFKPDINDQQGLLTSEPQTEAKSGPSGHFLYALSDKRFINKGWTKLPTEKIVRKLNMYRMRPAHPELDWFAHNKGHGDMFYDTGEKKADFSDDGYGRWYYKNGRIALDYYECEDGQNRFVVYSSGCRDERGRSQPITVLAMFDHSGNGIVFDHGGKIRLKYNQNEGVILDRTLGPVSHWMWHSLNEPPQLQQVMIDTQLKYKHPEIMKFNDFGKSGPPPDHEEINSIEYENFIKKQNNKPFRPYQINMKAMKINDYFSLKVIDQQTIYLGYRDGLDTMKLNLGMALDNNEIVDSSLAEIGEVELNIDKLPGMTQSIEDLQVILQNAQNISRVRQMERQLSKNGPIPVSSVDKLTAGISKARQSLKTINADERCTCAHKIPFANNLYYNTGFI